MTLTSKINTESVSNLVPSHSEHTVASKCRIGIEFGSNLHWTHYSSDFNSHFWSKMNNTMAAVGKTSTQTSCNCGPASNGDTWRPLQSISTNSYFRWERSTIYVCDLYAQNRNASFPDYDQINLSKLNRKQEYFQEKCWFLKEKPWAIPSLCHTKWKHSMCKYFHLNVQFQVILLPCV